MNLNDQSYIEGKTWGRCSKMEMLKYIKALENNSLVWFNAFQKLKLKTAWLPDESYN